MTTKASLIDLNGNEMILDADGDTSITADTDDQIDFKTAGTDRVQINSTGDFLVRQTSADVYDTNSGGSVRQFWGNQFSAQNNENSRVIIGSASNKGLIGGATVNSGGTKPIVNSYMAFESVDQTAGGEDGIIAFYTSSGGGSGTEKMRVTNDGNFVVGGTTAYGRLNLHGTGSTTTSLTGMAESSFTSYDDNGGSAGSVAGFFNYKAQGGLGGGMGIIRESASNWGTAVAFYNHPTTISGIADLTERMRIDSSGNVGIGITPTEGKLHIKSDSSGEVELLTLENSTGTNGKTTLTFKTTSTDATKSAQIFAERINASGHTDLAFRTFNGSTSERMRIDSSGNILVGTTSSTGALFDVNNTVNSARTVMTLDNTAATATNQYGLFIRLNGDPNNATNYFLSCTGTSATRARIDSDGGIQNYQSNDNNLCDEREKKNIEDLSSTLDAVKSWKIKKFHYQEDEDTSNKRIGVIAQDVETSHPELISDWIKEEANEEKGTEAVIRKGVKEQQMYWMAIKAIQEQQTIIEDLKARIETLEGGE